MHLANVMNRPGNTPQTEKASPDQVVNSAGGFVFTVDDWTRLDRFLVLGSSAPTYYATAQKLTKDNAQHVLTMIEKHGVAVVDRIVEISVSGRAPKQDSGIFALAACAGAKDIAVRRAALAAMPKVCRYGSTMMQFLMYCKQFRGWGRGLRDAVEKWYTVRDVDGCAYQMAKYQNRYGWTNRGVLRHAHPDPGVDVIRIGQNKIGETNPRNALYGWAAGKKEKFSIEDFPAIVQAYEKAHKSAEIDWDVLPSLTHEMIPTEWKKDAKVWEALLPKMPMGARLRNLATMTRIGLLVPGSDATKMIVDSFASLENLHRSRIHPAAILLALATYRTGKSMKGDSTWIPTPEILECLDAAFYTAFGNVVPAGKRTLIGLDVSGSMSHALSAIPGISAREVTTALSMIQVSTEPHVETYGFSTTFVPIPIRKGQRLGDVMQFTQRLPFSGTDCALPMVYAQKNKIAVDTFCVYTDSETYAGRPHPHEALENYRQAMGIPAKLVVVGTTATEFSIANPNDAGMLDCVGMDAALPNVIADFSRGAPAEKVSEEETE